ncbi:MAG: hypothetical protein ND895_19130 [Pyrinomonadaceae bacterium]|nr:hypothetical protein [Pyrinomonadaceae bacterium]
MELETRFTLLPFPQLYDGGARLTLRVVVVPRNQNPLRPAIEPVTPGVVPFAEAQWSFEARIISSLSDFPYDQLPNTPKPLNIAAPVNAKALFEALKNNFKIKNPDRDNSSLEPGAADTKAPDRSVKKYLPLSYRGAFNFTTPRTPNAVTDDSYRCAVRDAGLVPGFPRSGDLISWGKVFAYALRHRLLAEQLGMIYDTDVEITPADFPNGGYLYVDLRAGSDYLARQQSNPLFIKRYAARIPPLKAGASRQIFAPILFPVLFKEKPADPEPPPDGNYDDLFIEAAEYDDGFAKIVHAHQPHSRDLLAEESDGAHPVKDVGVRLGWDDEQILIWYMRQLTTPDPPAKNPKAPLDAPLGVFGYSIDVRETVEPTVPPAPPPPEKPWTSLNAVANRAVLSIKDDDEAIPLGDFEDELPYQVYPAQLDGDQNKSFWLPMYFANWNGHSMVLPDGQAAEIYRNTDKDVEPEPGTGVTGPVKNKLNDTYNAVGLDVPLRYGSKYDFRVRLRDLSGGGVARNADFVNKTPSNIGKCHFKRYVAPNQPRIDALTANGDALPANTDELNQINELKIRRPLIGYPAAVYIPNKYADAAAKLLDASKAAIDEKTGHAFGIADPDVNRVQVTVEVQTLKMDNLLSVSGKENYVHLYTTNCFFPPVNNEDDFEAVLTIPIVYRDCPVLHTAENDKNLTADLGLPANIESMAQIVVPRGRTIRLTVRAVCEDKLVNNDYYGLLQNDNDPKHEKDVRFGPIMQVMTYTESENEQDLFLDVAGVPRLQGIFMQPDPPQLFDGTAVSLLLGHQVEKPPDMIERLAKQLGLESRGLTLTGQKGERVQFGCSNRIRHILSPENSSLTFASKGDLMNHWLCCISLQVNRDWTWDALQDRAFVIKREKRFTHDKHPAETEFGDVGDIEIKHTAPFEALEDSQRNYTRLVFIDAVEPKNPRLQPKPDPPPVVPDKPRFPDTIEVTYSVETRFKAGHGIANDGNENQGCRLPITTPPSQVPKIVSAGIALSPYERNPKYSATEPRRRYLWVEFAEPVDDPNDHYFARMLAYAPDQLISNNRPELFVAPEEPPLPIDPEYIRSVRSGATNDLAGLRAMQAMKKATDSDRHYLLPLPKNLHANADEIFGFFTYEFRVGHYKDAGTAEPEDFVWCTAQGRFGRRLRVTGIQHPAPTLTCMVNRDEVKAYVSAPYAVAVFNGKNVTADPPRTQLWCLLYAQVKQADNREYRNILLDDKQLDWRVQIEREKEVNWFLKYDDRQRKTLKHLSINNWKDELDYANFKHVLKLTDTERANKDATKYGTAVWTNKEIHQLLDVYGLPGDSPLSVLVVEFLPAITSYDDHIRPAGQEEMRELFGRLRQEIFHSQSNLINVTKLAATAGLATVTGAAAGQADPAVPFEQGPSPASEALGQVRILRTSPLTEVPFVCCPDC